MTSQKLTFKSKSKAIEYAISKLVDGVTLTVEEQQSMDAAGVNLELVESYVRQALGSDEPEGED